MANLKEIRGRIVSVKSTQQMTKAMKMVAAAKLRRAQDNIQRLRPYALKLKEIMSNVSGNVGGEFESPYAVEREAEKILLIVVTSNRGLCGGFNSSVIKMTVAQIKEDYSEQHAKGNLSIFAIGRKGYEFFSKRGYPMVGENNDVFADLSFETVSGAIEPIMQEFAEGKWDRVDLLYNEFKNVVVQNKVVEGWLPLTADEIEEEAKEVSTRADYIFEPNMTDILEDLIPKSLKTQVYRAVLESNAGEQGARMTAMDSATNNAEDLIKDLKLKYNRARQAAITTEILEIVAGAEALGSS